MISLFRHYYYCIESRQRNYLILIINMNNIKLHAVILIHQELIQSDCSIKKLIAFLDCQLMRLLVTLTKNRSKKDDCWIDNKIGIRTDKIKVNLLGSTDKIKVNLLGITRKKLYY